MYLFQFLSVPSDQNHPPHFRSQCLNYLSVQYPTPDHVLQKPSIVREEMPKIKKSTKGFVLCKNLAGKNLFQKCKVMMHENSRFPVVDRPERRNKRNKPFWRRVENGYVGSCKYMKKKAHSQQ